VPLVSAKCLSARARLAIGLGFAACLSTAAATPAGKAASGGELFEGTYPVVARVRGHVEQLPPHAVRCQNCHGRDNERSNFGPPLTAESLLTPKPRRGGPPSAYDQKSFCRLLRTGVDPMEIVVRSAMPVYEFSDDQCVSMWQFLTRGEARR
jgi:hypothetical protein